MKRFIGIVIAAGVLTALPVRAGVPELLNAFGMFPLDAKVSETDLRDVCKTESDDLTDAAYICPDGLEYIVYFNAITTIQYIFMDDNTNKPILGVHAGDSEAVVVSHIQKMYGVTLKKTRIESWNVYSTDMTSVRSCGQKCHLAFSFDQNGHIASISKEPELPYI